MSTLPLGSGDPTSTAGIPGADESITVSASIDEKPVLITVEFLEFGSFLSQKGASRIFFGAAACNNAAQDHHINVLACAELLTECHRICMESNDARKALFLLKPNVLSWAQVAADNARLNFYNVGEAAAQQEVPLGYEDEYKQLSDIIVDFECPPPEKRIDDMESTTPIKTVVLEIAADAAKKLGINCLPVAIRCGCDAILMSNGRIGKFTIKE